MRITDYGFHGFSVEGVAGGRTAAQPKLFFVLPKSSEATFDFPSLEKAVAPDPALPFFSVGFSMLQHKVSDHILRRLQLKIANQRKD